MKDYSAYAKLAYTIVSTIVMLEKAIIFGIDIVSKFANCMIGFRHDSKLRVQLR